MTSCDRCGAPLAGFGVLHGLVGSTVYPDTGRLLTVLYCYDNGCRDHVLGRDAKFDADGLCSRCGSVCDRTPDQALLTTDLRPDGSGLPRLLTFCHAAGCADAVLDRATEGT